MTSPVSSLELVAPRSGPEFIEMRGISKRFGGVRALQDVSFSIFAAEIHSLAGENGCGKSTLIKVLSGVHAPDEGEIVLEGKSHSHLSPAASQRFGIQIIYQDLSLFPNLTVAENIAFRHVPIPVDLDSFRDGDHGGGPICGLGFGRDRHLFRRHRGGEPLVATILVQIGGNWFMAFALPRFSALLGVLTLIYYRLYLPLTSPESS